MFYHLLKVLKINKLDIILTKIELQSYNFLREKTKVTEKKIKLVTCLITEIQIIDLSICTFVKAGICHSKMIHLKHYFYPL